MILTKRVPYNPIPVEALHGTEVEVNSVNRYTRLTKGLVGIQFTTLATNIRGD